MNDIILYNRILGLENPWQVSEVKLDLDREEVTIRIIYKSNTAACPVCGKESPVYDHRLERRWRHLDSCQLKTFLISSVPRINCAEHGVKTVELPWASTSSRYSDLFEALTISLLKVSKNQSKTGQLLGISFDQVHHIMERAVERGLGRRQDHRLTHIGLDEKSMKKGHKYLTVLSDISEGKVIDVSEGRSITSAKGLLAANIKPEQRQSVTAVAMDMWHPYMIAANSILPEADIVHDKFHVMKYLNDSVDKTRSKESREKAREGDQTLKHSKYLFLKNQENMSARQKSRFQEIQALNLKSCQAWRIKENFKEFFNCQSLNEAKFFFADWYENVRESALDKMITVSYKLIDHANGLLNYIIHRVTNAVAEGLNGKIQEIKTIGRGFRAFSNYRIAILFFLGKLDLYPHKFL